MEAINYFNKQLEHVGKLVKATNKKSVLIIQQYPKAERETEVQFPPIRESFSNIICFVSVTNEKFIDEIISLSKGIIDLIVLDTDNKRINTSAIIATTYKAAQTHNIPVVAYSDYETWSIAAVNYLLQIESNQQPNVLLIGKSQLASHIILDLISRNVRVSLLKEEFGEIIQVPYDNGTQISLNSDSIDLIDADTNGLFDALLSCTIIEKTPYLGAIENKSFNHIYDIGLNNFTKEFIDSRKKAGCVFYRSDDHAGIASMIVNILESEYLVKRNLSRVSLADISVVSGGLIANEGDVVVDNADNPTAVFGVANGLGMFKTELTEKDKHNIEKIKSLL